MRGKFRPSTDDSLKAVLIMYFKGFQMRVKPLAVSPLPHIPSLKFSQACVCQNRVIWY